MDKVVHFEIPTEDMDRAAKFYMEIFGWQISQAQDKYMMAKTVESDKEGMPKSVGAINGGLIEKEMLIKSPVLVIDVSNVDEYLKKIESAGGKVRMRPVKMGEMGIYARFEDSEGNILGIWQNLER